ncbi:MAG: CBS domain-containing protein [Rhodospirillaceae bacterium TMED167]|nr:CBS domain-containing protein [Rhodospirillaceae bacterium]OUW27022.1 MAG: CBS domain-containing protein [Rhodospirillaceae bacterium TMED167]
MTRKIVPDIVTKQALKTLTPDATARLAARVMGSNRISAIIVIENECLVGIVTERDLTAKVLAGSLDPDATVLSDVMTANPDTLSPDDSPFNALELMSLRGYRHLPVVDGTSVIGMVSIRDLYAVVKDMLEDDIRQREAFIFDTGYGASA